MKYILKLLVSFVAVIALIALSSSAFSQTSFKSKTDFGDKGAVITSDYDFNNYAAHYSYDNHDAIILKKHDEVIKQLDEGIINVEIRMFDTADINTKNILLTNTKREFICNDSLTKVIMTDFSSDGTAIDQQVQYTISRTEIVTGFTILHCRDVDGIEFELIFVYNDKDGNGSVDQKERQVILDYDGGHIEMTGNVMY